MTNLLILNYEYPPLGGGAGVVSKYHAEYAAKSGFGVTVLTTWFEGESELSEQGRLNIIKLKSKRRLKHKSTPDEWLAWIGMSKKFLKNHLQSNRYDYCIAHFALPGGEIARYIHKKFDIPYAIVSHGQDIPWFFKQQMFKYHLVTYPWIKIICNKADKLILLTQAMKINADNFMGNQDYKNCIVPNGFDSQLFTPNYTKRSLKLKIVFIGRLVAQKDPMTVLKAIKVLKNNFDANNLDVRILGDGPMRKEMESFCQSENLYSFVSFMGWVDKNVVLETYQTSHIQIITSKAEAMSVAALEALGSGVYVMSTPVSGNTDLIEEGVNGELFNFSDYNTLSNKILNYYRTKFKDKYHVPEAKLTEFRSTYDWQTIVKLLITELKLTV